MYIINIEIKAGENEWTNMHGNVCPLDDKFLYII